jgi:hypothetical protein
MKNTKPSPIIKFWKNRPSFPVLIICIFESIGLLAIPSAIFSEKSAAIGMWYQVYVGLTSLMTIAILYFLWRMEKKGVVIYVSAYIIHNLIALIAGNWMIGVIIIPVVGLILISLCLKRFNQKINDNIVVH